MYWQYHHIVSSLLLHCCPEVGLNSPDSTEQLKALSEETFSACITKPAEGDDQLVTKGLLFQVKWI